MPVGQVKLCGAPIDCKHEEWKPLLTFQCISIDTAHILRLLVSAIVV
jgi:hypothetical protein